MAGRDHSHLRLDRTVVRDPPVACGPHTCVRYRTGPWNYRFTQILIVKIPQGSSLLRVTDTSVQGLQLKRRHAHLSLCIAVKSMVP